MTPAGLTLFYGGQTERKNVLNTIWMSYVAFIIATIMWYVVSYSFAYEGKNSIGSYFNGSFLLNIPFNSSFGNPGHLIPKRLFVLFEGAVASLSLAMVSGSIVGRTQASTWILFSFLWITFVYPFIAH